MLARALTITVLDFEGTGAVAPHPDEPWQLGMVQIAGGRIVPESGFERLLRVGPRPFSRHAPGRHAALRDAIAQAPPLEALWPALRPRLAGGPLAAHNVATERRFLRRAFPMHVLGPWIDTLKLARAAYPALRSHRLEDVVAALDLTARVRALRPDGEPHDALYDAVSCAAVLEFLLALPGWE